MAFHFEIMDRSRANEILPQLFYILHTNMSLLFPTGSSYSEDEEMWLSYTLPRLKDQYPETILMYEGNNLAGYCQYSIAQQSMTVNEVEIRPEYQRTMLFFYFCMYFCCEIPADIKYVESYVNKQNANSLKINQKIGLSIIGESKNGQSWHLRGNTEDINNYFVRFKLRRCGNVPLFKTDR